MRQHWRYRASLIVYLTFLVGLVGLAGLCGCASSSSSGPRLSYRSAEFRAELRERVPDLTGELGRAPFEVPKDIKLLAERRVMAAPPGASRVRALVSFLSDPKPTGLGLKYDWATSANAKATIRAGRGDCVALATVLVGLGRSLGWPIYFAEARTRTPITHEFAEVTVLSDHMVVVVLAKTVRMSIDFLGLVEEGFDIRPIDDLTAYAHLINNVAGHRVLNEKGPDLTGGWKAALKGFQLATQVDPRLGRAWNNLGIAYTRLGQFRQARLAYQRAVELDTAFGSAEHNLMIMETRAKGGTTMIESELP
jgi:tetratricopeptide (TPR) repeat protein